MTDVLSVSRVQFQWPGSQVGPLSVPGFSLQSGQKMLLLGESGSGKSTLLALISGTMLPQRGQIEICGADVTRLSSARRDRFRADHIGIIFQQFNLLPFASVADNILLGLRFAPERRKRVGDGMKTARSLCRNLGLPEHILSATAKTLSVGQQQRVAAARALIGEPPLILADEPTSALDAASQSAFLQVLFDQAKATGSAIVMVSHDARLAPHFDRVDHMDQITQDAAGQSAGRNPMDATNQTGTPAT